MVGSFLHNCHRHLELHHAVPAAGCVLHTLNVRLSPRELDYIVWHGGDRAVVVDETLLPELEALLDGPEAGCARNALDAVELFVVCGEDGGRWTGGAGSTRLPASKTVCYEDFIGGESGTDGGGSDGDGDDDAASHWPAPVGEEAPLGLCYTSGTTGDPKGVCYSHRAVYLHTLAICLTDCMALSATDVVCPVVPMFHISSWGVPYAALMLGFKTVLPGRFLDPTSLLDIFHDERVTISMGVPTIWQGVRGEYESAAAAAAAERPASAWDLGALERLMCGGSAPPLEMMEWYDDELGVEFVQAWGMTETTAIASTAHRVNNRRDAALDRAAQFAHVDKQGILLPTIEGAIVDPERGGRRLPHDGRAVGDLLVRGPWVTAGYHGIDAADAAREGKFAHVGSDGGGGDGRVAWCVTGDVCKVDADQHLQIVDRSKDLIKSGGEWISSVDLENALAAVPGVAQACVVAHPHPKWDERPVAVCVGGGGAATATTAEDVRAALAATGVFAKYELPDDVLFWDEIPLTSTGKMDKKSVRARLTAEGYELPSVAAK